MSFVGYSNKGGSRSENMMKTMENFSRMGVASTSPQRERFLAYGEDVGDWGDLLRSDEVVPLQIDDGNGGKKEVLTRTGVHASLFPEDVEDAVSTLASRAEDAGAMSAEDFVSETKFSYLPNGRVELTFPSEGIVDDTEEMSNDELVEYGFMSSASTINEDGEVDDSRKNTRVHGTMEDYNEFRRHRAAANLAEARERLDLEDVEPYTPFRLYALEDGSVVKLHGDKATLNGQEIDPERAKSLVQSFPTPLFSEQFQEKMDNHEAMTVPEMDDIVVFDNGDIHRATPHGFVEVGSIPSFFSDPEGGTEKLAAMLDYEDRKREREAREDLSDTAADNDEGASYAQRVNEAGIDPSTIPEDFAKGNERVDDSGRRETATAHQERSGAEMRQRLRGGESATPIVTESGRILFVMGNGDMFYADNGECLARSGHGAPPPGLGPQGSAGPSGFGSDRRSRGIQRLMPPEHRRTATSSAKALLDYDTPCWPWSRKSRARRIAAEWLDSALANDPEMAQQWNSLSPAEQAGILSDHERRVSGFMPQKRGGLFRFLNFDRFDSVQEEAPMPPLPNVGPNLNRERA